MQEAGRQLTEKQQSWKRLKWTLDSNSVCAAAQVVLRQLPETFKRTKRQRETARQTDSRTMPALWCSSFKNVASISKLFACNFNMKRAREFTCQYQQKTRGCREVVGEGVRGGVIVSPSKAVRQLDYEYESCMQICQNDYFSFCNCLAKTSKRERERERGCRIFRARTWCRKRQHFSTYIENARFCFILRAKLKLFDLHFNECNISCSRNVSLGVVAWGRWGVGEYNLNAYIERVAPARSLLMH